MDSRREERIRGEEGWAAEEKREEGWTGANSAGVERTEEYITVEGWRRDERRGYWRGGEERILEGWREEEKRVLEMRDWSC